MVLVRNPDLTWSQSALDYKVALDVIQHGVGRQYQLTRRQFSPIAVLWSPTSQRAAYAVGKFEEFVKEEENVIQSPASGRLRPVFHLRTTTAGRRTEVQGRAGALPAHDPLARDGDASRWREDLAGDRGFPGAEGLGGEYLHARTG